MPPELFLDLYSPPCRAIYIFALKNGIPFQLLLSLPASWTLGSVDRGHLKPEFLKVNPLGKVYFPQRSPLILLYLSPKVQDAAHGTLLAAGRARPWTSTRTWHHRPFQLPATNVYLCKVSRPALPSLADQERLDRLMGKLMNQSMQNLDQGLGHCCQALHETSGAVYMANLMAFTELMQPTAVGCDLFRDWPRLAAWRARVEAALGPELVQEAHKLLGPRKLAQELVHRLLERLG
uniref:Glutathione transferase n=1 Tax=Canis lupus familiaris TaxID=9615 RepID=A0A8I3S4W3_CANLF